MSEEKTRDILCVTTKVMSCSSVDRNNLVRMKGEEFERVEKLKVLGVSSFE